jgi:outer membrane protein assembly factor BamD (BamD/ComL family)
VHVREQAADFKRLGERFSAQWTPTILIIDHTGTERHRVEGFLPADDLLAELTLGLGHSAFARSEYSEAEKRFREVLERFPNSEVAAEAQYWAGVSRYKATNDAAALGETARQFTQRFQDSTWAKKASVWAK